MNLVNDTDADRANMKGYMRELDELASQQLSLVSTLRKVLHLTVLHGGLVLHSQISFSYCFVPVFRRWMSTTL